MSETPRIIFEPGVMKVVDIASGKEVDRPDIAARGAAMFHRALEAAGAEIVVTDETPDDVRQLFLD